MELISYNTKATSKPYYFNFKRPSHYLLNLELRLGSVIHVTSLKIIHFFQDLLITLQNNSLFKYYECCILITYSFTVPKAMSPPLSICLLLHIDLVIVDTQNIVLYIFSKHTM